MCSTSARVVRLASVGLKSSADSGRFFTSAITPSRVYAHASSASSSSDIAPVFFMQAPGSARARAVRDGRVPVAWAVETAPCPHDSAQAFELPIRQWWRGLAEIIWRLRSGWQVACLGGRTTQTVCHRVVASCESGPAPLHRGCPCQQDDYGTGARAAQKYRPPFMPTGTAPRDEKISPQPPSIGVGLARSGQQDGNLGQEEGERMEYIIGKLLQDFEQGKMTRRQLIQTLALTATAASTVGTAEAAVAANATYINHVSMQVADYTKTRDFYSGLFGMKVTNDDGKQCRLNFGNNILIAR